MSKCKECGAKVFSSNSFCPACQQKEYVRVMEAWHKKARVERWYNANEEQPYCDECGRGLNDKGECTNTNCGASPLVGTDWY